MRLTLILLVTVILATAGCASNGGGSMGDAASSGVSKDSVEAAIKAAEAANKEAGAVNGLWRDADKMIKEAKAAASKGELDKAMKLAKKAESQGKMGTQQANEQKNAKPWLF